MQHRPARSRFPRRPQPKRPEAPSLGQGFAAADSVRRRECAGPQRRRLQGHQASFGRGRRALPRLRQRRQSPRCLLAVSSKQCSGYAPSEGRGLCPVFRGSQTDRLSSPFTWPRRSTRGLLGWAAKCIGPVKGASRLAKCDEERSRICERPRSAATRTRSMPCENCCSPCRTNTSQTPQPCSPGHRVPAHLSVPAGTGRV